MEVGGRASHIVNIALEIQLLGNADSLPNNGLITARLNNPALMGDNGTEITATKAPSLGGNTEFNLLDSRHSPCSIIHRMPISFVRQIVDFVHFLCGKGHSWWILHNTKIPILLSQLFATESILLQIFHLKGLGKGLFVPFYLC